MTVKERLLQEIEQMPDDSLAELLDAALLIKQGTVYFRMDTLMKNLLSKEMKISVALLLLITNATKQWQEKEDISEEEETNDYVNIEQIGGSLSSNLPTPERKKSRVKALQNWFEKTVPTPADFDEDEAKWEYLKVKHNL